MIVPLNRKASVGFFINLSFYLDYIAINFSLHIVGLYSIIYFLTIFL